jgi:alkylation response protein AidB-like acyl-CoA dehydrogenase
MASTIKNRGSSCKLSEDMMATIIEIGAAPASAPSAQQLVEYLKSKHQFLCDKAEENERLGKLHEDVFTLLRDLKVHLMLVPKELGGLGFGAAEAISVIEQIAYSDPGAGWVAMVFTVGTGMAAGLLPQSGAQKIFGSGIHNIVCGSGSPGGRAVRVPGGYNVSGKWSFGSGVLHADWHHSGAFLYEDGKPKLDAKGRPQVMVVNGQTKNLQFLGNWDVLGLRATGSVDYATEEEFIPDDLVFVFNDAKADQSTSLSQIGVTGVAAIGHSGWAAGASRRILDELAKYAREKKASAAKTSSGALSSSESFWFDYGKMEGRVLSARSLLEDAWRTIDARVAAAETITTREITLARLALWTMTDVAADAADFAYRTAASASLRAGTLQKLFRDIYTGKNHITVSPGVLRECGRDLSGLAPGEVWAFYELVKPAGS